MNGNGNRNCRNVYHRFLTPRLSDISRQLTITITMAVLWNNAATLPIEPCQDPFTWRKRANHRTPLMTYFNTQMLTLTSQYSKSFPLLFLQTITFFKNVLKLDGFRCKVRVRVSSSQSTVYSAIAVLFQNVAACVHSENHQQSQKVYPSN